MRRRLGWFMLAVAIALVEQAQGSVVTFKASGNFLDGAILSGTVAIDVTTGAATAADLVVGEPDSLTFAFVQLQGLCCAVSDYGIHVLTSAPGIEPDFALLLPTTTLVGYNGGEIGSVIQPANGFESAIDYSATQSSLLAVGSLTAVAPEPSTSLLMASSFGVLAIAYGVANSRGLRSFHVNIRARKN